MNGIAAQCAHLAIWYIGLAVGEAQGSSGRRRKWPLAGPPFENLGRFSYVEPHRCITSCLLAVKTIDKCMVVTIGLLFPHVLLYERRSPPLAPSTAPA